MLAGDLVEQTVWWNTPGRCRERLALLRDVSGHYFFSVADCSTGKNTATSGMACVFIGQSCGIFSSVDCDKKRTDVRADG